MADPGKAAVRPRLTRRALRTIAPYFTAAAVLALCGALLFTVYFTRLELPWVSFLAGVLIAAVIALVSRASRTEWRMARRVAQLAQARDRLGAEAERRERAERALLSTRGKIELIDQHLPVVIVYLDRELRIQYHNLALRQKIGVQPEELGLTDLGAALGAGAFGELEPALRAALSGTPSSCEWRPGSGEWAGRKLLVHCLPYTRGDDENLGCFMTMVEALRGDAAPPVAAQPADETYEDAVADSLTGWKGPAQFLEAAIERNEFRLFSQRIRALSGEARERHELLLRLAEEEQNLLPPGAFLPVAERYGLMPRLDRWVVEGVLGWVESLGPESPMRDAEFFINLSAATVEDRFFPQFVREALHRRSFPGSMLCFEIDAHSATGHVAATAEVAAALKHVGCAVALAGFAAEKASFDLLRGAPVGYLTRVALDYLKIDGNLVLGILRDKVALARVIAINRIAHSMGVLTIAEFVESDDILQKLRDIGVDCAQGFGIALPQPLRNLD